MYTIRSFLITDTFKGIIIIISHDLLSHTPNIGILFCEILKDKIKKVGNSI